MLGEDDDDSDKDLRKPWGRRKRDRGGDDLDDFDDSEKTEWSRLGSGLAEESKVDEDSHYDGSGSRDDDDDDDDEDEDDEDEDEDDEDDDDDEEEEDEGEDDISKSETPKPGTLVAAGTNEGRKPGEK